MTRKNGNVKPQKIKEKERRQQVSKYRIKQTVHGLIIVTSKATGETIYIK